MTYSFEDDAVYNLYTLRILFCDVYVCYKLIAYKCAYTMSLIIVTCRHAFFVAGQDLFNLFVYCCFNAYIKLADGVIKRSGTLQI